MSHQPLEILVLTHGVCLWSVEAHCTTATTLPQVALTARIDAISSFLRTAPHSQSVKLTWGLRRPPRHVTARTGSSASPLKTVQSIKSIRETNMSIYSSEVGGKQFHLRCIISVEFVRTLIYSVYSAEKMVLLFRLRLLILSWQIFSFFLPRCFFVDHGLIQHTCMWYFEQKVYNERNDCMGVTATLTTDLTTKVLKSILLHRITKMVAN